MDHPVDYAPLIAFAAGDLSGAERERVADHVERCAACARTVARYAAVGETVRNDERWAPPAAVIARAQALFKPAGSPAEEGLDVITTLRRIMASLTFDSRADYAMAGLRAQRDRQQYQLAFMSDMASIDLDIAPTRTEWRIMGQVSLPDDEEQSLPVRLVNHDGEVVFQTVSDAGGLFTGVAPAGTYSVEVDLPGGEATVTAEPVEIG